MNPCASPLLTDLYELTMVHAYWSQGLTKPAVFEFFVRTLPPSRNFLVAAGLEQALDFLEGLRFGPEELDWIADCGRFKPGFTDYLAALRFTGDVDAMPEGSVFFSDEPILRVVAPLPQAQLVETRLINLLQFQSMVASKAARCVLAAPGKRLVDFGLRRAHGAEAGLFAARASYLAGFSGSSAALASAEFGIPVFGTMAHSFVQAYEEEAEAFIGYARANPGAATFLLDTYDTEAAAHKAVESARRLGKEGITVSAVRLDSGDLAAHARRVRKILDDGDFPGITIFASGNLDEYIMERLMAQGTPIDGFGIGTQLVTSGDAPSLDCVYKLQEYAGRPRRKRSEGKATWPGRKQVFRRYDSSGLLQEDVLTVEDDRQKGDPQIVPVLRAGRRINPLMSLQRIRENTQAQLERLPRGLRSLKPAPRFCPVIAPALQALAQTVDVEHAAR